MRKILILVINFLVLSEIKGASENDRYLSLPEKKLCDNRFKEAQYEGKNFFYSGHDPELKDVKYDWLDARNECRKRCMETISFKDQKKFDFFKSFIQKSNISFIWTSGRICDFAGCEGRWDLLPKSVKGWLWSADQTRIDDTNKIPENWQYTPWSRTGHFKKAQPDNAEFYIAQVRESCLGILNNQYNDSVAWHDIACYHKARFICEDSQLLLDEVEQIGEVEASEAPSTTFTTTSTTKKPKKAKEERILSKSRKVTESKKEKSLEPSTTEQVTTSSTTEKITKSSTTEAIEKQIEATEIPESTSVKPTELPTTTLTPKPKETTRGRPIPRRRFRAKTSTTTTSTTTEKSKQPLDSPPNDIQVEETTTNLEIETTIPPSTTTTTDSPIPRKFPRRTRPNRRNF